MDNYADTRHSSFLEIYLKLNSYTGRILYITLLPIGSYSAISGTISLSFQSSFHLSLTVLVHYRFPTHI